MYRRTRRAPGLHLENRGPLELVRAHGFHSERVNLAWSTLLHELSAEPRYTPVLVGSKNAADIALSIDAIKLLLTKRIDFFARVVNESDYAPFADRIRSAGALAIGYGGDFSTTAP